MCSTSIRIGCFALTTGASDDRTTALYGYQISTGEQKLLWQTAFHL